MEAINGLFILLMILIIVGIYECVPMRTRQYIVIVRNEIVKLQASVWYRLHHN